MRRHDDEYLEPEGILGGLLGALIMLAILVGLPFALAILAGGGR